MNKDDVIMETVMFNIQYLKWFSQELYFKVKMCWVDRRACRRPDRRSLA
jgi:hypothetical protein